VDQRILTPEEVASRLRVTRRAVYAWLLSGRLRGLKAGRLWRVREEALEAFLADRGAGPREGLERVQWEYAKSTAAVERGENHSWLETDLGGELPPYEWGAEGIPEARPVRYIQGKGLFVLGEKGHDQ